MTELTGRDGAAAATVSPSQATPTVPTGVSVVVVNWNGRHLLSRCLDSLVTQDYPNYEVLLVDNGSQDGSVDFVKSLYPNVRTIESPTNLGYAGGCNLGAAHAGGDYILLLNNDTKMSATLISQLARALDCSPETAAVAGVAVGSLEMAGESHVQIPILGVTAKHIVGPYDPNRLFYAPGTCVMYRNGILAQPFDPDYFAYDEDVYLSWRLRLLGHGVQINVDAYFEHEPFSTSRRIKSYVVFCGERNRWTNLLIFYESRTLARVAPLAILSIVAKLLRGSYDIGPKIHAYLSIIRGARAIRAKRALIQSQRVVGDEEITRHMTGAVTTSASSVQPLVISLVLR